MQQQESEIDSSSDAGTPRLSLRMDRTFFIKLSFSLIFLFILYRMLRTEDLLGRLAQVDWRFLVLSLFVSAAMVWVSCLKWRVFFPAGTGRLPLGFLIRQYLIGYFFSNLLPSNIGGDVVRSYYTGKRIGSQGRALVTVFLERFSGLLVLVLIAILGPLALPELYREPPVWGAVGLAAVLLSGAMFLLCLSRPVDRLERINRVWLGWLPPLCRMGEKILVKVRSFHDKLRDSLGELRRRPAVLLLVIALSLLFYGLVLLNVYVSYRAFGYAPPWRAVLAGTGLALIVATIPVAPFGGLGLVEWSFLGFFMLAGLPKDATLMMVVLLRCKMILLGLMGMGMYFLYRLDEGVPGEDG